MTESTDRQLIGLKGFTFDGDTGKALADLYEAVQATGCTRDVPFIAPVWLNGSDRPVAVNSYMDPEGRRVHVIWGPEGTGRSHVVDVILNAPSLARQREEHSCDCGGACGVPPEAFAED